MGQKWYVVTVGKKIGVFETWLEVAPLVKGVPGAVHQSFPSKDLACKLFEQEHAKGNTKIVDMSTGREWVSSAVQQSYLAQPEQLSYTSIQAIQNDARKVSTSRRNEDPQILSNGFNASAATFYAAHKPSPSKPRSPVQRNTIMSTAVVRSPSWLPSYPSSTKGKSNGSPPLSPLAMQDKAGLSPNATPRVLNSRTQFRSSDTSSGGRQTRSSSPLTISSQTNISDDDDPIILPRKAVARPMRGRSLSSNTHGLLQVHNQQTLYDSKSDPRSPMGKRVMSPLPPNSVLFGRPSPYMTSLTVDAN